MLCMMVRRHDVMCRTTRPAMRPAEAQAAACETCHKHSPHCASLPAVCTYVSCCLMLPRQHSLLRLQQCLASSQVSWCCHVDCTCALHCNVLCRCLPHCPCHTVGGQCMQGHTTAGTTKALLTFVLLQHDIQCLCSVMSVFQKLICTKAVSSIS